MMLKRIYGLVLVLLAIACVDPYEIKNTAPTGMLVVEGVFSNQLKRHRVYLSRATPLGEKQLVREQGATVTISDQNGNTITLSEETPGIYETPEISAQAGNIYTLHITTASGSEYVSQQVPFKDGADIDYVYGRYIDHPEGHGKGIQVYVDTHDPTNQTRFYRWNFTETYEVRAPFPSVWVWIGNNSVEPRMERMDRCYASDTLRHVLIRSTKDLEQDLVTRQPIRFIPEYSHILRHRYSILVEQFCLTPESYLYWQNLRTISEDQGSLSDIQPGSLSGNIVSLTNTNETVLGYFEACKVSERRIFFSAIDFYDVGLKNPLIFRAYCYDIAPILVPQAELDETMRRYERTMYIWDAFGESPATTFELMPKSCCDCRDQGPTERPHYF
jgi:hypothetical protein